MNQQRLIVDYVIEHAARHPDRILLTQPVGGGQVVDITWGSMVTGVAAGAGRLVFDRFAPAAV